MTAAPPPRPPQTEPPSPRSWCPRAQPVLLSGTPAFWAGCMTRSCPVCAPHRAVTDVARFLPPLQTEESQLNCTFHAALHNQQQWKAWQKAVEREKAQLRGSLSLSRGGYLSLSSDRESDKLGLTRANAGNLFDTDDTPDDTPPKRRPHTAIWTLETPQGARWYIITTNPPKSRTQRFRPVSVDAVGELLTAKFASREWHLKRLSTWWPLAKGPHAGEEWIAGGGNPARLNHDRDLASKRLRRRGHNPEDAELLRREITWIRRNRADAEDDNSEAL